MESTLRKIYEILRDICLKVGLREVQEQKISSASLLGTFEIVDGEITVETFTFCQDRLEINQEIIVRYGNTLDQNKNRDWIRKCKSAIKVEVDKEIEDRGKFYLMPEIVDAQVTSLETKESENKTTEFTINVLITVFLKKGE